MVQFTYGVEAENIEIVVQFTYGLEAGGTIANPFRSVQSVRPLELLFQVCLVDRVAVVVVVLRRARANGLNDHLREGLPVEEQGSEEVLHNVAPDVRLRASVHPQHSDDGDETDEERRTAEGTVD